MRAILILILVFIILGAGGVGFFLLRQEMRTRKSDESLEKARTAFEAERWAEVVEELRPVYDGNPGYANIGEVVVLLAQCYEESDLDEGSEIGLGLWREVVEEYPDSPKAPLARLRLGQALLEESPAEARQFFGAVASSDDPELSSMAKAGQAQLLEREDKIDEARALYLSLIENSGAKNAQGHAFDRLSEMTHSQLFSPQLDEFSKLYTVKRGDSFYSIAVNNHCTVKYLLATNRVPGELQPRMSIKVPAQGWRIVVDKEDLHLYLLTEDGRFVLRYQVGIGEMDYKTPKGAYLISNKLKEAVWHKPGGGVIRYGDEGYALGTRWMGIQTADGRKTGLGIHGTDQPETVGQRKSMGCIRMLNEKVEELFIITPVGTPVDIVQGFRLADYQNVAAESDEAEQDAA